MTEEAMLIPYQAAALPAAGDALVLAPHADDEVFGCAGAICAHLAHGHRVQVIIVTDGAAQTDDPERRRAEARAAAACLGYGVPECWELPDRGVDYGEALVERLRVAIETSGAMAIYAPSPWEVHPDHRALSLAATEAVRRLGGARTLVLYEVGAPLQPNTLLDLGPYLATKQRAMACFASQLAVQRYDRQVAGLNRFRAYTLGPHVEAAEAFLVTDAEALRGGGLRALHASPAARRMAQGSNLDAATQPLVSVICRTMGRPEFADAVASVAVQTYPIIELIVVDAAARRLTLEPWCGRFPLRIVTTSEPLERGAAAKAGLDAARGEYCLFLDEDDWIDADHIAKLSSALSAAADAPAAYTHIAAVDAGGAPTGQVFNQPFDAFRLLTVNELPIHAVLFRSDCIVAGCRIDTDLAYYEDWDFWLQVAALGDFVEVQGISGYYRQGGHSGYGAAGVDRHDEDRAQRIQRGALHIFERALNRTDVSALYRLLRQARDRLCADQTLHQAHAQTETSLARATSELAQEKAAHVSSATELAGWRNRGPWLEERSALLERVLASTPWRLSAPYRWLVQQLNRLGIGLKPGSPQPSVVYRSTRREGIKLGWNQLNRIERYQAWRDLNAWSAAAEHALRERLRCVEAPLPKLSVVLPVYQPDLAQLRAAVASVQAQVYDAWELCIADDASPAPAVVAAVQAFASQEPRIRLTRREVNGNISAATNSAAELATGDFLVFLDQDDVLTPDALAEVALYLAAQPETDYLYSDEDKIDASGRRHYHPQFKPDWSPELLLSYMFCGHLVAVRRSLFDTLGGCRIGFEGSQDHDFAMRATERARHVGHIPKVLYHWRATPGSVATAGDAKQGAIEAGRRAVAEALSRRGVEANCLQPNWARAARVGVYAPVFPDDGPPVAIIIPTSDRPDLLRTCLESLRPTTYRNYEVLVVDNGSHAHSGALASTFGCRVLRAPKGADGAFNFSRLMNRGAASVSADYLLFLNDDTAVIDPRWLSQMVGFARLRGVGAVGARLLFPDGSIQHAGIVHGLNGGTAGHAFKTSAGDSDAGYLSYKLVARNTIGVTAACMLTTRAAFEAVSGFDEERFPVAYSDLDYCWRLGDAGLRSLYCPDALLIHHESATRPRRDPPEYTAAYRRVYSKRIDPYYNPHLSLDDEQFRIQPRRYLPRGHGLAAPRVLFASHLLDRTGAALHLFELTLQLKRRGHLAPAVLAGCDGPLMAAYRAAEIPVRIDPEPFAGHLRGAANMGAVIARLSARLTADCVDAVFANTLDSFAVVEAAAAAGVPSVWNIHESGDLADYIYAFPRRVAKRIPRCFALPYRVIFVAHATRALYADLETRYNFMVIPNALDPGWLDGIEPSDELPHGQADCPEEIVLLCLGTVCERKGQADLLQALPHLPAELWQRLRCNVVGDRPYLGPGIPNPYSVEVHRLHATLPEILRRRVEIIPETSDVQRCYRDADIFVCTSRVESAPRVILEAMAMGLPIITTPVFGIEEQVMQDENALFYAPGDAAGLAECIRRLLSDAALRARMADASSAVGAALPSHSDMMDAYQGSLLEAAYPPSIPPIVDGRKRS
jgi:glycosyltransferase involved in cell wall biosynthesis/LmbE family N-acetylglucosaminyl deacetylase